MKTMKETYEKSMSRTAFTLTLLTVSGGMALLLAAVGIYAVMFVRNGLLWGGIGVAAGLAGAVSLSRLMTALLFDVSPVDPLTYSVVVVGLLAVAAGASYLPARRITRVDPLDALRAD
jgi:ABC-type antimicrobial peptide transport system permease subunit